MNIMSVLCVDFFSRFGKFLALSDTGVAVANGVVFGGVLVAVKLLAFDF